MQRAMTMAVQAALADSSSCFVSLACCIPANARRAAALQLRQHLQLALGRRQCLLTATHQSAAAASSALARFGPLAQQTSPRSAPAERERFGVTVPASLATCDSRCCSAASCRSRARRAAARRSCSASAAASSARHASRSASRIRCQGRQAKRKRLHAASCGLASPAADSAALV